MFFSTMRRTLYLTATVLCTLMLPKWAIGQIDSRDLEPSNYTTDQNDQSHKLSEDISSAIDPQRSVDLFTGQHQDQFPLVQLSGRGGLGVDLQLVYNGNVYETVIDENRNAQASAFGLGFRLRVGLGFESIYVDHNGTTYLDDDKYFLIMDGQSIPLVPDRIVDTLHCCAPVITEFAGYYVPKTGQPWVVHRSVVEASGIEHVVSWDITTEDGTVYLFGDSLAPAQNLNATRNILRYGQFVGSGVLDDDEMFLHQWDLRRIRDAEGVNWLDYTYQREEGHLLVQNDSGLATNSANAYIRASYVSQIESSDGQSVEFTYRPRADYQPFYGVNIYEFYQTLRASSIVLKSSEGEVARRVDFVNSYLNYFGKEMSSKLLLKSIEIGSGDDSRERAWYSFEYDTDLESPSAGSLLSVKYPSGAKKVVSYGILPDVANMTELTTVVSANQSTTYSVADVLHNRFIQRSKDSLDQYYVKLGIWQGHWKTRTIYANTLGTEYAAISPDGWSVFYDHDLAKLLVYREMGGTWTADTLQSTFDLFDSSDRVYLYPGRDCFVAIVGPYQNNNRRARYVYLYRWNGETWQGWEVTSFPYVCNIYGAHQAGDVFGFSFENSDDGKVLAIKYDKERDRPVSFESGWMTDFEVPSDKFCVTTDLFAHLGAHNTNLYRYNKATAAWNFVYADTPGSSVIARTLCAGPNGVSYTKKIPDQDPGIASLFFTAAFDQFHYEAVVSTGMPRQLSVSNHSIFFRTRTNADENIGEGYLYEWNGTGWVFSHRLGPNLEHNNTTDDMHLDLSSDYCGLSGPWARGSLEDLVGGLNANFYLGQGQWFEEGDGVLWSTARYAPGGRRYQVMRYYGGYGAETYNLYTYTPATREMSHLGWLKSYSYGWGPVYPGAMRGETYYSDITYDSTVSPSRGVFAHRLVKNRGRGPVPLLVVDSMLVYRNEDDSIPIVTTFSYFGGLMDQDATTPLMARTTVSEPHNLNDTTVIAYNEYHMYNDIDSTGFWKGSVYDSIQPPPLNPVDGRYGMANGGYLLDGKVYMDYSFTVTKDELGDSSYTVYNPDTSRYHYIVGRTHKDLYGVYRVQLQRVVRQQDGVLNEEEYTFNALNGLIASAKKQTGDDQWIIDSITYAFSANDSMFRDNALSQVRREAKVEVLDSVGSTLLDESEAEYELRGSWRTCAVKRIDLMWGDTLAVAQATAWDGYGNIVTTQDGLGAETGYIYDLDSVRAIADLSNASPEEVVFMDFEHGSIGNIQFGDSTWHQWCDTSAFTGERSFLIAGSSGGDYWGPVGRIEAEEGNWPDTSYQLSVWVRGTSRGYLYVRELGSDSGQEIRHTHVVYPSADSLEWVQYTFECQPNQLLDYHPTAVRDKIELVLVRAGTDSLGNPTPNGAYIMFDDVRMVPSDALLTTRTYDPRTNETTSESGHNNVPVRYEYDGLGRVVATRDYSGDVISTTEFSDSRNQYELKTVDIPFYTPLEEITFYMGSYTVQNSQYVTYDYTVVLDCEGGSINPKYLLTGLGPNLLIGPSTTCDGTTYAETDSFWVDSGSTFSVCRDYEGPPWSSLVLHAQEYRPTDPTADSPAWSKTTTYQSSSDSSEAVAFYDPFGQEIQRRTRYNQSGASPATIVKGQEYDARGRVIKDYKPYFDTTAGNSIYTYDGSTFESEVNAFYSDSGAGTDCIGYPFREFVYESEMTGRLLETRFEGSFLAHPSLNEYGVTDDSLPGFSSDFYGAGQVHKYRQTNENGSLSVQFVDRLGNLIASVQDSVAGGLCAYTRFYKDWQGNDTLVVQPTGTELKYQYNNLGWLLHTESSDKEVEHSFYDQMGRLRLIATPTELSLYGYRYNKYDRLGRIIEQGVMLDFLGFSQATAFDANKPDSAIRKIIAEYEYDQGPNAAGRLTKWTRYHSPGNLSDSASWGAFEYDEYGRVVHSEQFIYGVDSLVPRTYDAAYDLQGNVTRLTYSDGTYVDYEYDPAGQVRRVTDGDGFLSVEYEYWPDGSVKTKKLGDVGAGPIQTVDFAYNARGWLESINDGSIQGNDLYSLELTYDEGGYPGRDFGTPIFDTSYYNGNIASYTLAFPVAQQVTQRYAYDALDRLAGEHLDGRSGTDSKLHYRYDANGNIDSIWVPYLLPPLNTQYAYNYDYYPGTNRVSSIQNIAPDSQSLTYNSHGGVTAYTHLGLTMDYNLWQELSHQSRSGIHEVNPDNLWFYYNAEGQRIAKNYQYYSPADCDTIGTGHDTTIIVDKTILKNDKFSPTKDIFGTRGVTGGGGGEQSICTTLVSVTTGYYYFLGNMMADYTGPDTVDLKAKYVYVNGDRVARFETDSTDVMYYLKDHLGSTVGIASNTGQLRDVYRYRPFGAPWYDAVQTGDMFNYTGQLKDQELNHDLYYYGARYYDPILKIFTQVDPLYGKSASWSSYVYVKNNPMKYVDPDGRDAAVSISDNKITVRSVIYIYGDRASSEVAQRYQSNINSVYGDDWSYTHDDGVTYDLNFDIAVKLWNEEHPHLGIPLTSYHRQSPKNFINVVNPATILDERSYIHGGWKGKCCPPTKFKDHLPHEVGHLLGLMDRYTDEDLNGRPVSRIHDGWSGNLMANGSSLDQRQVNGIGKWAVDRYNNSFTKKVNDWFGVGWDWSTNFEADPYIF